MGGTRRTGRRKPVLGNSPRPAERPSPRSAGGVQLAPGRWKAGSIEHVSFLHSGGVEVRPACYRGAKGNQLQRETDKKPVYRVGFESDGGLAHSVLPPPGAPPGPWGPKGKGHYYWRVRPWIMPSFHHGGRRAATTRMHGHFLGIYRSTTENCLGPGPSTTYPTRALPPKRSGSEDGRLTEGQQQGTSPGTFRPLQNKEQVTT